MKYPSAPLSPFPPILPNQSRLRMPCPSVRLALSSPPKHHRFANPFLSSTYELLFQQLLCFPTYLCCPLVFFVHRHSPKMPGSRQSVHLSPILLYSMCCSLLALFLQLSAFVFYHLQALLRKYRGVGGVLRHSTFNCRLLPSGASKRSGQCIQLLTLFGIFARKAKLRKTAPRKLPAPTRRSWSTPRSRGAVAKISCPAQSPCLLTARPNLAGPRRF
jgi:hypothetical protein